MRKGQSTDPAWPVVYERWQSQQVPKIQVIPFDIDVHYRGLPWLEIETGKQATTTTNPQNDTAYHLSVLTADLSDEAVAAYKLSAYFRPKYPPSNILSHFALDRLGLEPAILKNLGLRVGGWWNPRSRHVLPECKRFERSLYWNLEDTPWQGFLDEAAATWTEIASRWMIVRIPSFMKSNSAERRRLDALERERYGETY